MGNVIYYDFNKGDACEIKIFDIAKYFLSKESMNHLKLQKLCYYAQAWYYTLKEEKLADTTFQAWVHGPVSYPLYLHYKQWGWYDIPKYYGEFSHISEDIKKFLDKIYELYGKYSGEELEKLTHSEDPWKNARNGCAPSEYCTKEISLIDIKKYYINLLK